jgi:hypothetical protein
MESFLRANRFSNSQEIPRILWDPSWELRGPQIVKKFPELYGILPESEQVLK